MSSMVAVGSTRDRRAEESEPCRVMDLRCRVRFRSARKPGWTLRLDLGEVGTWGKAAAAAAAVEVARAAGGSGPSAGVSRVLSLRLGRVGGGAFLEAVLDHCGGGGCCG